MTFVTAAFVRRLSVCQREELVRHVAEEQPFIVTARGDDGRYQTVRKLLELKLVEGEVSFRPRFTRLTLAGREAAAMILGEYADALVAAGCLEEKLRPIDLVNLIKNEAVVKKLQRPAVAVAAQTLGRSQT